MVSGPEQLCSSLKRTDAKASLRPIPAAARSSNPRMAAAQDGYQIGPADILQVTVWKNENLSRTVTVRPDGMISLPLLNEVRAAGLSPMQLREVLARRLTQYIPRPEVSVIVEKINSRTVSVLGDVNKPGRYEINNNSTVLDVIAQAEGFGDLASRSRVLIMRTQGSAKERTCISFSYDEAISAQRNGKGFFVEPGDVVIVPRVGFLW